MKDKGLLSIEQVEVNEMQIENLRLVDIIVRLNKRKKQSQKAQGRSKLKLESLCLNNDEAWLKQRLIRKAMSQGHLARNQTTPQVRSKCLYCDVVASPANLATYHNDHCIHRPGYEAINQARRDQVSGERMNRRNELIEGRRQWLHQTLDSLSPEEKQATGLMSPVKQKGKIQQVWGPIPYQCKTTGQWYSVNLKEATRQYKEWVASQDRNKTQLGLVRECVLPRLQRKSRETLSVWWNW